MVLGVSDVNYGYYGGYVNYDRNEQMYRPNFRGTIFPNDGRQYPQIKKKNEKVGFWEGTKAFFKGLIKPIKNMIAHPIKTALFVAGAAALVAFTGGAALPLLIGAGFAIGGYQVAKGAYKAISADTREETLAGLEGMGEGTFTIGASVAGARSYAVANGGSATAAAASETTAGAKFVAYAKGLGVDSLNAIKAVPESARATFVQIASGKAAINVQSAISSVDLAKQKAQIVEALKAGDKTKAHELLATYRQNLYASKAALNAKRSAMFDRCNALSEKFNTPRFNNEIVNTLNNGFKHYSTWNNAKYNLNPLNNLPEENLAIGLASDSGNQYSDVELENALNTFGPAFGFAA